jgi:hypothetical protein
VQSQGVSLVSYKRRDTYNIDLVAEQNPGASPRWWSRLRGAGEGVPRSPSLRGPTVSSRTTIRMRKR